MSVNPQLRATGKRPSVGPSPPPNQCQRSARGRKTSLPRRADPRPALFTKAVDNSGHNSQKPPWLAPWQRWAKNALPSLHALLAIRQSMTCRAFQQKEASGDGGQGGPGPGAKGSSEQRNNSAAGAAPQPRQQAPPRLIGTGIGGIEGQAVGHIAMASPQLLRHGIGLTAGGKLVQQAIVHPGSHVLPAPLPAQGVELGLQGLRSHRRQ